MILDGIDVFVKVVEAGGFSAAARSLGMPTTTVSAKIARLEERLGVTLIQRSTRKMHVSAAGEAYYLHCVDALKSLEAGEDQLRAASAEPSGILRLTAPPDLAQTLLPPVVQRFVADNAKVVVEMIVTNRPVDLLAEGVDLALRASPVKDSRLMSRKVGSAPLGLFAAASYLEARGMPRTGAELAGHEVMVHSRLSPDLALASGTARIALKPSSRIRVDDMQTLRVLAARGAGIALLPDFPGARGSGETLTRVLPDYRTASGALYFVYPGGKFTPVNVRTFIDLAVALI